MRVAVGSKAPPKVEAVREVLRDYVLFSGCIVEAVDIPSNVRSHPLSFGELIAGADHRAVAAYGLGDCKYSFGIEDGSIAFPGSRTGWSTISVCSIFDGKNFYHGHSSGFQSPKAVMDLVLKGVELSDAWAQVGWHNGEKLGYQMGSVGLLSKGRLMRKDQVKEGIRTALIELENPEYYSL